MLNNRNFNKPKKKEGMSDIDFFSHVRRAPLPEEEAVGIEDYNSKENQRVLRELTERQAKDEEVEDEEEVFSECTSSRVRVTMEHVNEEVVSEAGVGNAPDEVGGVAARSALEEFDVRRRVLEHAGKI